MPALKVLLAVALLLAPLVAADNVVTDDSIYDQVRIRLAGDREVGRANIEVKVSQGVVELHGKVRTEALKSKAEKIAKKVKGVRSVSNQLVVSPS